MDGFGQETPARYYTLQLKRACYVNLHKVEGGIFRILGRTSVDIIKSGGYKISALDIERVKHYLNERGKCVIFEKGAVGPS